ncbi:MAG TPA: tRNA pseudouridine(55) synthase TruB, partial [Myxococcota bacterium]|nr:tRNA pseudouridine(55) synthase TruB [Myxococcota bacterium]
VDKPRGMTSFTALRAVQRALDVRGAGHAGTLDPMATGVLVVLIGEVTKLSALLMDHDKEYLAEVTLGRETDTLDAEGETTGTRRVPPLDEALVRAALAGFVGTHLQVPPRYSAIKKDGRTHMSRARNGESFDVEARPSLCHAMDLVELDVERGVITVRSHVGKGYYIRSFARDLAVALGTVGHLSALRRTRVGVFDLARAIPPEDARPEHLVGLVDCVPELARLWCGPALEDDVRCGRPVVIDPDAPGPKGARLVSDRDARTALALTPAGGPIALVDLIPTSQGGRRVKVTRGLNVPPPQEPLHR